MYILGIHASGPISSAALIKDGSVLAAAPEERFVRRKHTLEFLSDNFGMGKVLWIWLEKQLTCLLRLAFFLLHLLALCC